MCRRLPIGPERTCRHFIRSFKWREALYSPPNAFTLPTWPRRLLANKESKDRLHLGLYALGSAIGRRCAKSHSRLDADRSLQILYTLIETARLNDIDPQAWLADVIARIADHPINRIDKLLPWKWKPHAQRAVPSRAA